MKIIKKIFIGILIFLTLLILVSFFLPRKVRVERSMVMNASQEIVFNQVNNLKNWTNWSPWYRLDSTMGKKYEGPEAGINAKYSWDSKNSHVMKGSMIINDSKPNDFIGMELDFEGMTPSAVSFIFAKADSGTKISWITDMDMGWNPFGKYAGLFMDKLLGSIFQEGLKNMKEYIEKLPPPTKLPEAHLKIVTTTVQHQDLLAVRIKCHEKEISKFFGESFQKLGAYAGMNHLNIIGPPLAIYYHWENDDFDFDAAMPIDKKIAVKGEIKAGEIKAGNVVMTNFYGAFEGIGKAHALIKDWMKTNNKKQTGAAWEVYMAGPGTEKDTTKWLTQVFYPVN